MRLLTISDLTEPGNDWKPLLGHIAALQTVYDNYTAQWATTRRLSVTIGGKGSRAPGIHASEICGCLRQAAYSLSGTPPNENAETTNINMKRRFDAGHMQHALIQDDFQRMCTMLNGRLVFEDEVRINSRSSEIAARYNVSSSTDGLFTFYDEHDNPYLRILLEIKTMSKDEYEKAKRPKEEHILQGMLYQRCLDVPLIWFLYYNKSNSNTTPPLTPWIVPYEEATWKRLEGRINFVHNAVANNELPEREEGMPCSWCAYAKTCDPSYNRMAAARATPAPPTRARKLT